MENYTPLSIIKIRKISINLSIMVGSVSFLLLSFLISNYFLNSKEIFISILVPMVFGFFLGKVLHSISYNYLTMLFKRNIHIEINQEYQRIYDEYLIQHYGGKDYIENLREKASPQAFKEEYKKLIRERDDLLREF